MKVGDLVMVNCGLKKEMATIIHVDEPSITFPFQVAEVAFFDGTRDCFPTTTLEKVLTK
jgi:hypothetical protein